MTNTLENQLKKTLLRALVQRAIFCPFSGELLDVDTCGYFVDADGDPNYVMSMSVYMGIAGTDAENITRLEGLGYFLPAELPAPGVALRD